MGGQGQGSGSFSRACHLWLGPFLPHGQGHKEPDSGRFWKMGLLGDPELGAYSLLEAATCPGLLPAFLEALCAQRLL